MSKPLEALSRALLEITVGSKRAELAHRLALAQNAGAEVAQHIKVPVKGKVGRNPLEFTVKLKFPQSFMYAPNQSSDSLPEPHFNYGVQVPKAQKVRPEIRPYLLDWIVTDEVWFSGCHIRVNAYIPNAPRIAPFKATLHLTFFGWSCPIEEEDQYTDG